jgi:hypothetical protein
LLALLYVHLLIANSSALDGGTKREIINSVLAFRPDTTPMPEQLSRVLDAGLISPGRPAFNSLRWRMFAYLTRSLPR